MNLDNGGHHDLISTLSFGWPNQTTSSDVANATPELANVSGDGYPDLVIVARTSGGDYAGVAFNQQDGQFTVANSGVVTTVAVPDPTTGVVAGGDGFLTGDVTGNGRADLIAESVADKSCPNSTPSLTTWLSDGQGRLTKNSTSRWPTTFGNGDVLADLQAVDLNGDLKTDIAGYQPAFTNDAGGPTSCNRPRMDSGRNRWRGVSDARRRYRPELDGRAAGRHTDGCPPPPPNKKTRCTVDADQRGVWGDFDGDHRTDLAVLTRAVRDRSRRTSCARMGPKALSPPKRGPRPYPTQRCGQSTAAPRHPHQGALPTATLGPNSRTQADTGRRSGRP